SEDGYGYASLRPFLKLWKAFRNIIYLLFVIVFVVIGLGVMLRLKVDNKTVMTVQAAIPKIVVALILVTLSYAIVGFLIDMMWFSCYFLYELILKGAPLSSDFSPMNPLYLQGKSVFGA